MENLNGGSLTSSHLSDGSDQGCAMDAQGSPPDLHHYLKAGTTALHVAVESDVESLNPFATVERYRTFILGNLSFYRAFEAWAAASGVSEVLRDWPARRKEAALVADTEDLAAYPDEEPAPPTELLPPAPVAPSLLLGALYVTEGSTLGAAVLAKRAARLGFGPTWGARFFHFYGSQRTRRWRAFLQVLNAAPLDAAGRTAALDTALQTFETYRRHVVAR